MGKANPTAHLAIDLGASSGRAMLGVLDGTPPTVTLHELHRFEHVGQPTPTGPVWDLIGIWSNILEGVKKASQFCRENGFAFASVGVDTWGVDWALLGQSGELLSLPHCYRDPQNNEACEAVLERIGGFGALYRRTGIQRMAINTIFQVAARFKSEPTLFEAARHLVFMPDLFHYWLSGTISVEHTIASTSSMLSVTTGDWDRKLLKEAGLPTHLLGPICQPGTRLGTLLPNLAEACHAPSDLLVIAPASHDTASAIVAIPAESEVSWAYLSSGTWSLLGAEIDDPIVSPEAEAVPFTNESGFGRSVRLLKNISGLWMVQELRRELNQHADQSYSFEDLMEAASLGTPYRTIVDPNVAVFLEPGNMKAKLETFALETNQPLPETVGDLVRCCLESLALCYRETLNSLEAVLGLRFDQLNIVGGGSKNSLLNQLTANAIGRPVVSGPAEATAMGNVLVQAIGWGAVEDLEEVRAIVRRSCRPVQFDAQDIEEANVAFVRFQLLREGSRG